MNQLYKTLLVLLVCLHTHSFYAGDNLTLLIDAAQKLFEVEEAKATSFSNEADATVALFNELQQTLINTDDPAIIAALALQSRIINIVNKVSKEFTVSTDANNSIKGYAQRINLEGDDMQQEQINRLKNRSQTNLVLLSSKVQEIVLFAKQTATLLHTTFTTLAQHRLNFIPQLMQAEQTIGTLLNNNAFGEAQQAADLAKQIGALLTSSESMQQRTNTAKRLSAQINGLLPPEPTVPTPPTPTPPTPTPPTPPRPPAIAPGKAAENINKVNSKLNSALRRLDAIKKYYAEIESSQRTLIKKTAENIFKDSEIVKFAHRIQQVKHEAGAQLDPAKLAPFNTFVELFNRISNSIKGL